MLELQITFTYDKVSNLFFGTLQNGARFAIEPTMVGGKLGSNLQLFRSAVLAAEGERPFMSACPVKSESQRLVDQFLASGGAITKVGPTGRPQISLEDLGL